MRGRSKNRIIGSVEQPSVDIRCTKSQRMVSCDRIGWDAIQHKDGWWIGTAKGVTCYGDHELARIALAIIWQREGGRQLNYRIKSFTGANVANGEHTPKLSAVDALNHYEANGIKTHH